MTTKRLTWLVLVAGGGLVVHFVFQAGPLRLFTAGAQMGWGLATLLGLPVLLYIVHALGWSFTMSAANRQCAGLARLTLLQAFSYGLAGVVPLQVFVAEPLKLSFLRHPGHDRDDLGASLVVDNTINGIAIVAWALGGIAYLTVFLVVSPWLRLALLAMALALVGLCGALVLVQRRGLLSGVIELLGRWRPLSGLARRHAPAARRIDDCVKGFYRDSPCRFGLALACHLVEKLHGVAEFWVIFRGLGTAVSWGRCFFIFAVVSTLDNLLFFVQLGGMEAWVATLLALLSLDRERINITVALFRRLRMLLWAAVALLMLAAARLRVDDRASRVSGR